MEKEYVIAIDIGGTNLKADLVDREGNISDFSYTPSHASEGREALLTSLKKIISLQMECGKKIVGIAAGSPGTVNNATGVIDYMQAHIPNWTGTRLGEFLSIEAGVPSQIDTRRRRRTGSCRRLRASPSRGRNFRPPAAPRRG